MDQPIGARIVNSVLFKEVVALEGKKIGIATLNAERSLNALSLDMVELLQEQLSIWNQQADVAIVILEGSGEKAFCAGGDVVQLHTAAINAGEGNIAKDVEQFFAKEYQLDYLIHTFSKPLMVWGHGIVMGGGLGLLAGASHKVVTERSRIAMPEITIGLYPDVAGSYFLNKMPKGVGLFLGLTGASINAADAKYVSLADHFVNSSDKKALYERVAGVKWGSTNALNHQKLTDLLIEFETNSETNMPEGNIKNYSEFMESLARVTSAIEAVRTIINKDIDDKWFNTAQKSLAHGSPLSAHIIKKQLELGSTMTLAECFQMEVGLSVNCAAIGDFAEGVRALLIDKDNKPAWKFKTIDDVDNQFIAEFFKTPWSPQDHPLRSLIKEH